MALTLEQVEKALRALAVTQRGLDRRLKASRRDYRIPDMVSEYNIEDALFPSFSLTRCSAALTLSTSYQDIVGMSVTVVSPGTYAVRAFFDVQFDTLTAGNDMDFGGRLVVAGTAQTGAAKLRFLPQVNTEVMRATVGQEWKVTIASSNTIVKVQGVKGNNVGTGTVLADNSVLTIQWAGP